MIAKKHIKGVFNKLTDQTKRYLENTTIHGLSHIVNSKAHKVGRLFWICICILSFLGTYQLFAATLDTYSRHPISFVTDTSYLGWNTSFPAITICESNWSQKKLIAFVESKKMALSTFAEEIFFYQGSCSTCAKVCKDGKNNCTWDYRELLNQYRSTCENLLKMCSWNGKPFDCCRHFEPIESELGKCYSFNSIQTPRFWNLPPKKQTPRFYSNLQTGRGKLTFRVQETTTLLVQAPQDVPILNGPPLEIFYAGVNNYLNISFQVRETYNDPMLMELPIEARKCRFSSESYDGYYPNYSYSACFHECRKKRMMELCQCLPHTFPDTRNFTDCTWDQLSCLHIKKNSWFFDLKCDCLSHCQELEFFVPYSSHTSVVPPPLNDGSAHVFIELNTLPSHRYVRNVVRSKLDLVVSLGGAAGLFLGASLLSTVELIYFCCIYKKQTATNGNQTTSLHVKELRHIKTTTLKEFQHAKRKHLNLPGYYPRDYPSGNELYF